jgi:hypothetical protein
MIRKPTRSTALSEELQTKRFSFSAALGFADEILDRVSESREFGKYFKPVGLAKRWMETSPTDRSNRSRHGQNPARRMERHCGSLCEGRVNQQNCPELQLYPSGDSLHSQTEQAKRRE